LQDKAAAVGSPRRTRRGNAWMRLKKVLRVKAKKV